MQPTAMTREQHRKLGHVFASNAHITQRVEEHGKEYLADIYLAMVENTPEGAWFDPKHEAWARAVVKYRKLRPQMHGPFEHELFPNGLGTRARQGIALSTLGVAPLAAKAIERAFGKKCRCGERERCLNRLVPDVSKVGALDWVGLATRILKCMGGEG